MYELPARLQARLMAVSLVNAIEQRLYSQDYGETTEEMVDVLLGLDSWLSATYLFDGLPGLLDRYSNVMAAWKELS